nr:MAG TPA: hypothetical protein [Caudoviricetes sp.]
MKFAGINPACALKTARSLRVALKGSDLSSQWQNMAVCMVNKEKS